MTLAQLRYLIAIVDAGLNITEAAAKVNATQSGLSQQLKLLEEELGFQIFVRRGRKLDRVSEAGAPVVESARLIVAEAGNIDAMAANERGEAEGDLKILTTQAQAQYVLPGALSALRIRFPGVRVQLALDPGVTIRDLMDRAFDIAILSAQQATFPNCAAIPLYRWSWRLLVRADHVLAACQTVVTLDEIERFTLVGFESAAQRDGTIAQAFARAGLAARIAYSAPDSEVIKAYVRANLGIGLIPEMTTQDLPPDLIALPVEDRLPSTITWAITPLDRVTRDYNIDLLRRLAPRLSVLDIRRIVQFGEQCPLHDLPRWQAPSFAQPLRLAG